MEHETVASSSRGPPHSPTVSAASKRKRSRRIYDVDDRTTKTDVGSLPGTSWTLSSYKPGSGVPELRSPDLTKLWQSDGNQPHLVNIQFARRTCVTHISVYLDVKQDDSYTPTKIAIKAGTNYHDLTLVRQRSFDAPQGWKHFSMTMGSVDSAVNEEDDEAQDADEVEMAEAAGVDGDDEDDDDRDGDGQNEDGEGIRVWLLQMCILANHLNGKDTHIRRLIVFGPKQSAATTTSVPNGLKRAPLASLAQPGATSRLRTGIAANANINANGNRHEVTLAQLLALQTQPGARAEAGDLQEGATPPSRTALNLFGNIR